MSLGAYPFYITAAYGVAGIVFFGILCMSWIQVKMARRKYKKIL